jgi:hypothetical protein
VAETRECHLCHRIGYRAFVPYGDWAWRCLHDNVCIRRRMTRPWPDAR